MRVAIFTDNDFGKINGVTTTLNAVLRWAEPDISPRVYTSDHVGADRPEYLALRSIGVGIPCYAEMKLYLPRILAFAARARADGIELIHYTTPGPVGLAAQYTAWALGVPMVGSFHTHLAEYTEVLTRSRRLGQLMRAYLRWPYGSCERVLVPSKTTAELLIAARIRPEKLRVWTRGVDTEQFRPARRSEALRKRWGASPGRLVVIYVGRISREKGLHTMPELWRTLRVDGMPPLFVFVGDGPMRDELQAACPGAVFTGPVAHHEVGTYVASGDVFVFPSSTDSAGNVILEAQSSGLPVLVSDEGGPRENMVHGETGFVCVAGEPLAFASRVRQLVSEPSLRIRMGRKARQYAEGRSWPQAMASLYGTYREVRAEWTARQARSTVTVAHRQRG